MLWESLHSVPRVEFATIAEFTKPTITQSMLNLVSFKGHLTHIDKVFSAIEKSGVTLSPAKCHLAYQSLMLLGQKVSLLGLSTHKVDAILELSQPRNVHELQTFLGMMVHFSSYIPFYAWIVAPLFRLLKKGSTWELGSTQHEAFELAKSALVSAPVKAYAIPGLGYRVYSDACDVVYDMYKSIYFYCTQLVSTIDVWHHVSKGRVRLVFYFSGPRPWVLGHIHVTGAVPRGWLSDGCA
jgi:hypothetical protein